MTVVKIKRTEKVETEIEVTFPLFYTADYGGDHSSCDANYRFDEDGTLWEIKRNKDYGSSDVSWEIEKGRWRGIGGFVTDWDLLKMSGSATEFQKAKSEALTFLSAF